ncbi:MAG: hypothetical protein COB83_13565 [Gammaproteobacteria bacterium]|nr:MAG: hypothetical protein COB83_13565 [Gammaproteobacteria bacterium]
MLEGEADLSLSLLNKATQAWLEQEYHHRTHSELACSPYERYVDSPNVGRDSPDSLQLRQAFRQQITRKQRRSDGTISIEGKRFEIPAQYKHLEKVTGYARWDLTQIDLVDSHSNTLLCRIYPLDKAANATGQRRALVPDTQATPTTAPVGIAPLMKKLMADYAATGLPQAYMPKDELKTGEHQ